MAACPIGLLAGLPLISALILLVGALITLQGAFFAGLVLSDWAFPFSALRPKLRQLWRKIWSAPTHGAMDGRDMPVKPKGATTAVQAERRRR